GVDVGRREERAAGPRGARRRPRARARAFVDRGVGIARRVPGGPRLLRARPRGDRTRALLRLLPVLVHAGADADDAALGRVLSGHEHAGVAAIARARAAAHPGRGAREAAAARTLA